MHKFLSDFFVKWDSLPSVIHLRMFWRRRWNRRTGHRRTGVWVKTMKRAQLETRKAASEIENQTDPNHRCNKRFLRFFIQVTFFYVFLKIFPRFLFSSQRLLHLWCRQPACLRQLLAYVIGLWINRRLVGMNFIRPESKVPELYFCCW